MRQVFDLDPNARATPERSDRPVVRLCNLILSEGLLNGASEVRLAQYDPDRGSVEYCIAGEWRRVMQVPVQAHLPLINRLKVMAGLSVEALPDGSDRARLRVDGAPH